MMIRATILAAALLATAGTSYAQVREGPPPSPPRAATNATYPAGYTEPWIEDSAFVYGPGLLNFDVAAYLGASAPHLLPYAEVISHWCGFYSVSPKVLLAILEVRSRVLSSPDGIANPTAGLVAGANFADQVQALLATLTEDFYAFRERPQAERDSAGMNGATFALVNAFRDGATIEAFAAAAAPARASFIQTLTRLFPEALLEQDPDVSIEAIPPADLLQMPWTQGQSWYFNGVHTNSGNNSGIRGSIDLTRSWSLVWGDDTSTDYVVAAFAGTVTRYSSCEVRVTSPSGWAVNYYHLDQIQVTTGQQVTQNQRLAIYAGNQAQALCQGGSSTGPHVHFSLMMNGFFSPLDGATLGTFLVHTGRYDYDYDPAYMWLERNGTRYYAYQVAIPSYPPSGPTIVINDVSLSEGNSSTKNATFTVSLSAATSVDISFSYATANGTATAGSDFVGASGSAIITAGSLTRTLNVSVNGDTSVESTETFPVNLSSPSFGTLGDSQGVATIINDDFTDSTLSGVMVKLAHIAELRTLINERRTMRGLGAYTFTALTAQVSTIKASHIVELRSALADVYTNAGQPAPTYTDPTLTEGSTTIRSVHLTELRTNAVSAP